MTDTAPRTRTNLVLEMAAALRAEGISYAPGDRYVMAYPRDHYSRGRVAAAAVLLGLVAEPLRRDYAVVIWCER